MATVGKQAVGSHYVLDSMNHAQRNTWDAVHQLARQIEPGMLESEAVALCKDPLTKMGMDRIRHPVLVRFGANA